VLGELTGGLLRKSNNAEEVWALEPILNGENIVKKDDCLKI